MTQQEIQERNKEIALMLGDEYEHSYHLDWNWLMEAVEFIEKNNYTFIIEDKKYPIYTSNFNKNEWIKGTIKAGPDSIIIDPLKIKIEQTFIIGEDRTGFLGLGRSKPFIEVVNKNPYAETEKLKTYQVDIKSKGKNKTWVIIGTVMGATGMYFLIK